MGHGFAGVLGEDQPGAVVAAIQQRAAAVPRIGRPSGFVRRVRAFEPGRVSGAEEQGDVLVQPAERFAKSREGTPFFTPPVIDPDTGEALDLDELIRHYKSGG